MPGIFDLFSSDDPMKQQGLLAAAAAMLDASGPSTTPRSFGQVMAQGIGGYQKGMLNAQTGKMNDLKLKDAESDLKNQEMLRERQRKIAEDLAKLNGGGMPGMAVPAAPDAVDMQPMASAMPGVGPMSPKIGGPEWLQAYQAQQPQAAPAQAQPTPSAAPENMRMAMANRLLQEAQVYAKYGDFDSANKRYEAATKLQPKYTTEFRQGRGADGKLHNYLVADDGTLKDAGVGVKPDMVEIALGDRKIFDDKNAMAPGQSYTVGQSPDSKASNATAWARLNFDKSQASANQDDLMDPLAVRMTAQQYLAGDAGALQNFGRGAQGAKNLNAVRLEIARQATEAGMSGADIAAKVAEFGGMKAGQRTAGTRSANIEIAANEAAQLAPLALEASRKVARSGFLPFGKAQIMFNSNTNDPNMRQFAMANTALVNAYGQAMARGGAATVSDKDHARELLSTSFDQPSYEAAVGQLQAEIKAAQAAPRQVRRDMSNEVSGKGAHDESAVGQFSITAPDGKTYTFPDKKALNNFKLSAGIK
jgi:hypothetical protein